MQKSRKRKQQKDKNTEVNGQVEIKMVRNNMLVCALKVKTKSFYLNINKLFLKY